MIKNTKRETLRDFFERNTNLFTVLGIFNALAIYSSQIPSKQCSDLLSFSFTLLSLSVLVPIIFDIPDDESYDDEGFQKINITFMLLRFGLVLAQFFLGIYTLENFPGMFTIVIFI